MAAVLVIDQDETLIEAVTHRLGILGVGACVARTGYEALALLAMGEIDLVLTGIDVPDMSGLEMALRVRSDHPGVPIVAHATDLPEPGSSFFDGVVVRPAPMDALSAMLHTYRPRQAAQV